MSSKNGHRRLLIRSKELNLDGDYEGWNFTVRTNPALKTLEEFAAQDIMKMADALAQVVLGWNFVDEGGKELGQPSPDTIRQLPIDLITTMVNKTTEAITTVNPQ